jgi:type II secretory pathway component PulC
MRWSFLVGAAVLLGGCGSASAPHPQTPEPAQRMPAGAPQATPTPSAAPVPSDADVHTLKRSAVREAVSQGLGAFLHAFLQRIELDYGHPVRVDGKFRGFRIAALHDASFWSGVDLKPGDVVTAVNGLPIERPEQAQSAFDSLEAARELRVSYERDGKARELVYPIVDDR